MTATRQFGEANTRERGVDRVREPWVDLMSPISGNRRPTNIPLGRNGTEPMGRAPRCTVPARKSSGWTTTAQRTTGYSRCLTLTQLWMRLKSVKNSDKNKNLKQQRPS